jgi:hypothetical protein
VEGADSVSSEYEYIDIESKLPVSATRPKGDKSKLGCDTGVAVNALAVGNCQVLRRADTATAVAGLDSEEALIV